MSIKVQPSVRCRRVVAASFRVDNGAILRRRVPPDWCRVRFRRLAEVCNSAASGPGRVRQRRTAMSACGNSAEPGPRALARGISAADVSALVSTLVSGHRFPAPWRTILLRQGSAGRGGVVLPLEPKGLKLTAAPAPASFGGHQFLIHRARRRAYCWDIEAGADRRRRASAGTAPPPARAEPDCSDRR